MWIKVTDQSNLFFKSPIKIFAIKKGSHCTFINFPVESSAIMEQNLEQQLREAGIMEEELAKMELGKGDSHSSSASASPSPTPNTQAQPAAQGVRGREEA